MNQEIQVMEEAVEATARTGLTRNQKIGIVAAAAVLTAGIGYGVYRLVKFWKTRKAAKAAVTETEVQE